MCHSQTSFSIQQIEDMGNNLSSNCPFMNTVLVFKASFHFFSNPNATQLQHINVKNDPSRIWC